jgi:hypothetical protein
MDAYIRLFAHTDETKLGILGADFCDALVSTGIAVRLVPARIAELQPDRRGNVSTIWDRHRSLLITPMKGELVNMVCGTFEEWGRFYTTGVQNYVLVDETIHSKTDDLTQAQIEKYASIYRKYDEIHAGTSPKRILELITARARRDRVYDAASL